MSNHLRTANKHFQQGDNENALKNYEVAARFLRTFPNPPKSLIAHCEQRITLLRRRRQSGDAQKQSQKSPTLIASRQHWDASVPEPTRIGPVQEDTFPLLSIVIPHYESLDYLIQCLKSIASARFGNIEAVVVDDASPSCKETLEDDLRRLNIKLPITLVCLATNSGPSACRNIGISVSEGRVIFFLDADDYLDEHSLRSRWELLNGWAHEAASFTSMSYVDADGRPLGPVILTHPSSIFYKDFTSNKFPCSAIAIKRKFLECDRFDESLVSGEDYEFFSRLAQRGVVYRKTNGTIWFRQHAASLTHKDQVTDVRARKAISKQVYERQLNWSSTGKPNMLAEAILHSETASRTFPVACLLALQGKLQSAETLISELDLDSITANQPEDTAKSIRFFISRENIVPDHKVDELLQQSEVGTFIQVLASSFRFRHIRFLTLMLRALFPGDTSKTIEASLAAAFRPTLLELLYTQALQFSDDCDFIVLRSENEKLRDSAAELVLSHLTANAHLEGLFLYKVALHSGDEYVDLNSIAPSTPDSYEIKKLGSELFPGIVLDRTTFLLVQAAVKQTPPANESLLPAAFLKAISSMRVKAVGGIPGAKICIELPNAS